MFDSSPFVGTALYLTHTHTLSFLSLIFFVSLSLSISRSFSFCSFPSPHLYFSFFPSRPLCLFVCSRCCPYMFFLIFFSDFSRSLYLNSSLSHPGSLSLSLSIYLYIYIYICALCLFSTAICIGMFVCLLFVCLFVCLFVFFLSHSVFFLCYFLSKEFSANSFFRRNCTTFSLSC